MANSIGQPITSRFYDGPVDGEAWAAGQPGLGDEYFVATNNAGRVRIVTSATRQVEILAGSIGGHGVKDEIDATITIGSDILVEPTSGSRWYLISANRDWTLATPETKIIAVQGTATKAIPDARQTNPGTGQDDHPLALVQITKGESQPTDLIDLRGIGYGSGMYLANSTMVMDYMSRPGYRFRVDGVEYVILLDGSRYQGPNVPRWGSTSEYTPEFVTGTGITRRYWAAAIPVKPYDRVLTVNTSIDAVVQPNSRWELLVRYADSGSPNNVDEGAAVIAQPLSNSTTSPLRVGAAPTVSIHLPANLAKTIRVWVRQIGGAGIEIENGNGIAGQIYFTEARPGNDW